MNEYNTYPVFVADQVLTAEHLNQAVNYLDEQGRLTRNRLIGIGIVCGLELRAGPESIEISKGCGVTSEGYLILQERKVCTYFRPYSLPEYFSPEYKPVYEHWHMWELLSAEDSLEVEDPQPLKGSDEFLRDKIVVLLLEMKEKPLKNCIEIDCEDKGEKIEFRVKPLLVQKKDLDEFAGSHNTPRGPGGVRPAAPDLRPAVPGLRPAVPGLRPAVPGPRPLMPDPRPAVPGLRPRPSASGSPDPVPQELKLRRFNVPARELKNTNDVFGAFLRIVPENTLKQLAETLNACYHRYQPVLGVETNPFEHAVTRFSDTLSHIKAANPFFIQYFYDWIDDIIKGYNELECRIFDVQAACCPDRDLFPLHLMLGEADKSTEDRLKASYRHYFIYSPLFNGQKDLLSEVRLLFRRLVALIESFKVPDSRSLFTADLKITPSLYLDKPLSQRCIPYYYDPGVMYPVWSWEKARRGNERSNLSYHAGEYSTADTVLNPLNYDIEAFNFFRVEGHIGKPVSAALPAVVARRNAFNLPFEVVALSTATVSAFFNREDHDCHFRDLESLYQVLLAEMRCKFGEFECRAAKIPYRFRAMAGNLTHREVAGSTTAGSRTLAAAEGFHLSHEASRVIGRLPGEGRVTAAENAAAFRPGDFLRSHCLIEKGSVGEAYLNAVADRVSFGRISALDITAGMTAASRDTAARAGTAAGVGTDRATDASRTAAAVNFSSNGLYASLFYFIHSVERMMEVVLDKNLDELNIAVFSTRYEAVMDAAGDLARIGDTLERLDTGNDNYEALLERMRAMGFYELSVRIHALLHVCLDDRLRALREEYQRRIRELRLLTNLMQYAKKHPGMEHKAGVPKGGTFIMVYHESPRRRALADIRAVAAPFAGLHLTGPGAVSTSLAGETREALIAGADLEHRDLGRRNPERRGLERAVPERGEMDDLIREAYVSNPALLRNFEKALDRFMGACRDMDDADRERIKDILTRIPREEEPLKFQVPEEAVIADFYLPYVCCSDCAPVSYVLPAPPREILSINIKPTEFCNDDARVYPVTVSPAGGKLTASAGGMSSENSFSFSPKGLKGGVNTLTYTLADGRSTSIDLLIAESFQVSFRTRDVGDLTLQFIPGFSEEGRQVIWDFGDGVTSTEFSPLHTYQFAEREANFAVTLRVANGPCTAEAVQTVTLQKPVDPEFSLQPRVFCVRDRKTYEFNIQPFPEKLTEISNKDKLIVSMDETAKKLVLVPARHRIRATKDYHLEYKGAGLDVRIVVPDASFTMQIQWMDVDNLLVLKPKQMEASNYAWTVSQGNIDHSFDSQTVEARLSELKLDPRRDISISLRVNHQLPSGNCADEQKFAITPELFRKYQGSGDVFDNRTIQ